MQKRDKNSIVYKITIVLLLLLTCFCNAEHFLTPVQLTSFASIESTPVTSNHADTENAESHAASPFSVRVSSSSIAGKQATTTTYLTGQVDVDKTVSYPFVSCSFSERPYCYTFLFRQSLF